MKHLHFGFIAASLAIGFGAFLWWLVFWQAWLMSLSGGPVRSISWFLAGVYLVAGTTLIFFGWPEIRREIVKKHKF